MTQVVVTLWWLGFWTAVGLCLGSFLNVVIYRLPRDKSLRAPLWSVCPSCGHRIRWYDNLPIISFIRLGGRCRNCRMPIPTRYLVVEASMALVVLMLIDAFFIGQARAGLSSTQFGLTDHLSYDWPILVAHIALFACLLSMAAIDLQHYWVDVRFTNVATLAGFVLHALWTPRHSGEWIRPSDSTAVMSLFALVGLGIVWIILACHPPVEPEDCGEPGEASDCPEDKEEAANEDRRFQADAPSRTLGWASTLMLVVLFVLLSVAETAGVSLRFELRAALPLVLFLVVIFCESAVARESDQLVMEAIREESHGARKMVLTELALLLPAVLLGLAGLWIMHGDTDLSARISKALHADVRIGNVAMLRSWAPLYGLATAASGYIIAGALGWAVRIVFTLIFGKEAFGSGDIHMMAAAGCIAGWPIVGLGFFAAIVFALAGWVLTLPFKRTRALPLGPWLALGFLTIAVYYERIIPTVQSRFVAPLVSLADMLFSGEAQLP